MKQITFKIETEPVAKARPRFARIGKFIRTYTPLKTKVAEETILSQAMPYAPVRPIQTPVEIELIFNMPILKSFTKAQLEEIENSFVPHVKKPDIDNLIKTTTDALNGVFFVDDSLIFKVTAVKRYAKEASIGVIIRY